MTFFKNSVRLAVMVLAFVAPITAQQFQTQDIPPTNPIFAVNAKYVNGVAPGYAPTTALTGLTLTLSSGTNFCNSTVGFYAGGTITLAAGATNYVYLDTANNCIPTPSTAVFTTSQLPIAIVTTSSSSITSITDVRNFFSNNVSGGLANGCTSSVSGTVANVLGAAFNYALLAGSGITNSGISAISGGNIGSFPTATITGFPPGTLIPPAIINNPAASAAQTALAAAITFYQSVTPTLSGLSNLSTGGNGSTSATYTAGNYFGASSLTMPTGIILDAQGNPNAVFVFVAGSTINLASGQTVALVNGAQAGNVVFIAGSSFTAVSGSTVNGNILAVTSITLGGGTLNGRALANTGAVTISTATNTSITPVTGNVGNLTCTGTITAGVEITAPIVDAATVNATTINATNIFANAVAAKTTAIPSPAYDVTQYNAVGNGTVDDTTAIQAAFDACWNGGASPHGGNVVFQGHGTYLVTKTIYGYDSCLPLGVVTNFSGSLQLPSLVFAGTSGNGTNLQGTTYTTTSVTVAANNTGYLNAPYFPAFSPSPTTKAPFVATLTVPSTAGLTTSTWVQFTGCTSTFGKQLNNGVAQIAEIPGSGTTFTVPLTFTVTSSLPGPGTSADTCTVTVVNVTLAFDTNARNNQTITNLVVNRASSIASSAANNAPGYQVYWGSRLDAGSGLRNANTDSATYYDNYIAAGSINMEFNDFRCDGGGCIYDRVSGSDALNMTNGTMTNNFTTFLMPANGGFVTADQSWEGNIVNSLQLNCVNIKTEPNASMPSGAALYNFQDNSVISSTQFTMSSSGCWSAGGPATLPIYQVVPQNDSALSFEMLNSSWGSATGPRFVGMQGFQRDDMTTGSAGKYGLSAFAVSAKSMVVNNSGVSNGITIFGQIFQLIGDVNVGQMWQHKTAASMFLYADNGLSTVLPNGTTLYVGQIVANNADWQATAVHKRYPLQVVDTEGTIGSPNGGATTCTVVSGVVTVSSGVDLSIGQHVSCSTMVNKVLTSINAANPAAVILAFNSSVGADTSGTLTFSPPVLGLEVQLPTKTAAVPTTLTWSQGDVEQLSTAAANGPCLAVTVVAGTPGTWAKIPCGDVNGNINVSQITGLPAFNSQGTLSSGVSTFGASAINAVLVSTKAAFAGHFTELSVATTLGGACTTAPQFNVFDLTSNFGTAVTASSSTNTIGTSQQAAQTLTFAAGDQIGIFISTAGATCTTDQFTATAMFTTP